MNKQGLALVVVAADRSRYTSVSLVALAASYEAYALATGKVPTISGHVKTLSRHKVLRYGVMFGMGFFAYHFLVGDES